MIFFIWLTGSLYLYVLMLEHRYLQGYIHCSLTQRLYVEFYFVFLRVCLIIWKFHHFVMCVSMLTTLNI